MLQIQSLQQLRQLKLLGLADALEQQFNQPNTYDGLSFSERIGLLIQYEMTYRNDKRLQRLLKAAHLKVPARLEDVDYSHPRGLGQSTVAGLQSNEWIKRHQNLVITGPTGCGKTYLACALGHHACHQGYRVRYFRASRLFEQLTISHGDGSYLKLLAQIAKMDLLIIDDWGLEPLTQSQRNDLLEIMEDRHNSKSTLFTSQLPLTQWHDFIADPTLADAILDRLLHNAHKLNLKGESMRKLMTTLTEDDHLK
ncbi:IS21-like element helper ATPase IstB [Alkalimarinus alittae]|uniref:IS21-like element helper ATPase IstB n=1 Tax=Alkalimarinus alittae TaxID=2961619 RepID=A0ABY6N7H2_9ALTE|nr:IS21-like element helper ATPase IstB [Alkalimarinus alittae]UZE94408.1 IS21-like element helper ATPase IstB [Alkalimarinus alittae]UZE97912.1 IS21-like element helper ATPase IstB [Alkalimarinus alittae]